MQVCSFTFGELKFAFPYFLFIHRTKAKKLTKEDLKKSWMGIVCAVLIESCYLGAVWYLFNWYFEEIEEKNVITNIPI
jgi:hypothetical protein